LHITGGFMNTIKLYTKEEANNLVGGCSKTSKMPCLSWSTSAWNCITGAKMAKVKGSICSQCYAMDGFYRMNKKKNEPLNQRRLDSINHPEWVQAMIHMVLYSVKRYKTPHFRWHDSGDLQSVEHLHKINQVAQALPDVLFWLPTREYDMIKQYVKSNVLNKNLIVRLSAMFVDEPVKVPVSLQGIDNVLVSNVHSKTVPDGNIECESYKQGNECKECRACWDINNPAISYKQH